ncbi:MAG: TlyA family RNA methyltransferase [Desulfuromonadales bacterium]|nr:TlyA family RNA methyltransferase [Desulfuromonadales bacterium]
MKERIDKLLVDKGVVNSRERAKALIMAGEVIVDDHAVSKAGEMVDISSAIKVKENIPFVSRGGLKLQKALDDFDVNVNGMVAIDVGASTGGFTDCLLQRGAARVFAIDVGYGQLAWKLRQDPRVLCLEKTNIRHLQPAELPEPADLAVIDASFISLEKILPNTLKLLKPIAAVIALIKPQFEVGKGEVGKGGIVREPEKHQKVIANIEKLAADLGLEIKGITDSPILGAKGNKEFLIYLLKKY